MSYTKQVEEALVEIEKTREFIISLDEHVLVAEEIIKDVPNATMSIAHDFGSLRGVIITIHAKHIDEVVCMLKKLSSKGYRLSCRNDYTAIKRATWTFKQPLHLSAFFDSPNSVCHFVKVGEHTVEDYKLVCSDGQDTDINLDEQEV